MRVAFVHPDLGIGGAERLVVNAALALQKKGHVVKIYTSHFDQSRCFSDLEPGGPLGHGHVRLFGSFIPRTIFGRFHVVCAILRMCYASMKETAQSLYDRYGVDVIFCDQVSHNIPVLRTCQKPILFYCHYPDKLLCTDRGSMIKRLYRRPIDWLEEYTTGLADVIAVNSEFTKSVFVNSFQTISSTALKQGIRILYPAIELEAFDRELTLAQKNQAENAFPTELKQKLQDGKDRKADGTIYLLSINRFERKKNLALAIRALGYYKKENKEADVCLMMAGGYDARLEDDKLIIASKENVKYMAELKDLVRDLDLEKSVFFIPSFTDDQRVVLLQSCRCVLYTPDKEHFGIVPIEAMYAQRPVVAVASGGPLESIVHGKTGFLQEQTPQAFAQALSTLVNDGAKAKVMGLAGRKHVASKFSLDAFADSLDSLCNTMINESKVNKVYQYTLIVLAAAFLWYYCA